MRRVLITGSNRGIGLGLVRHCLERGDRVFATCRQPELALALNRLQEAAGDRLTVLPLDVTRAESITGAAATVNRLAGGLDLLLNNAGVGGADTGLAGLDAASFIDTYRVNVAGPLLVTQACADLLAKGVNPLLISITSRMGSIADNGSGGWYSYRASKAALNMLNASLAIELRPKGIAAVVLHPGWVQTDMGGARATLTVDESVAGLLEVIDSLTLEDSGRFLDWTGQEIPW